MALLWLAQLIAGVLLAFSLRRAVLLIVALWPPSAKPATPLTLNILVLVPCRNEAASLPGLFKALEALDYPRDHLHIVIIDDGSTDDTARLAQAWCGARHWARLFSLPHNVGKPQALNAALSTHRAFASEVVLVYDADHRPAAHSLHALGAPFADVRVAGVSGQMRVVNGAASPAAFYTMLESHVHQFITMRAKDRLNLAPALLGSNCAYRLSALQAVGGFTPGALVEDSDLTLAFALHGWHTRFVEDSVSQHHAPVTLRGYLQQHLRWNRGFHQLVGIRLFAVWASSQLSFLLKLELTVFALGYADRLALLAAVGCTVVDFFYPGTFRFPRFVWLIYFGLPALAMFAALALARERLAMFLRLVYVPFFFALDIAIAVWANFETLARKPFTWGSTERTRPPETTQPQ